MPDIGDTVHIGGTCRTAAGTPVNAATVALTVTRPDGTTESPTVANPPATTGEYGLDYIPAAEGHYEWWLRTTGPPTALTGSFDVRPAYPGLIVSLADAKAHLNIATTTHDEELRDFIAAVTAVLEGPDGVGHPIVRRAVVDTHDLRGRATRSLILTRSPVVSVTSITSLDTTQTWAPADFDVDTEIGMLRALPAAASLTGLIRISYVAGYQVIPASIGLAARIVLHDAWTTQRGSRGAPKFAGQRDDEFAQIDPPLIPRRARALLGGPALPGIA